MEASTVQGDLYGEKAGISRGHSSQMPGLMSRIRFGKLDILKALQSIAPVVAVQGNMDYGEGRMISLRQKWLK
jgi:hypothetical protein